MDLPSNAERRADTTRGLPNFKQISLPGLRETTAELLNTIGRVEGIFSTYTVHDISHIDTMLQMLDWLIPSSTQEAMTPPDWLMVVLAIYFHDAGMIVTADEFLRREENPDFVTWIASLSKSNEGREYLARTGKMSHEEKERFFFTEFVRKGHAARIREWITGRHSTKWTGAIRPIVDRFNEMLRPLPPRFRDYLGVACESHHKNNLDNRDLYPLTARFGNDAAEVANVQYASLLLRTVDLLHVTKDRTPSEMYQLIRFSDPKAVEEWDKQLGAFAVGPKRRKLVDGDPDTAIVVINADFTEERPLFALQEYIAYADAQVQESKRCADKSAELPEGSEYRFPWWTVQGDVRLEGVPPHPLRFELDRGRLLDLLVGHTIYNDPTVAVREILQNGIDAVRYRNHLDRRATLETSQAPAEFGTVRISWDPGTRLLVVADTGVGMDRDTITHHLMNVGASFYNTPQFETEHRDFSPISRFGIGILTCFMVSDDIEIVTFRADKGHRIRMTSVQAHYLLRELQPGEAIARGLEPHGTRVSLRLRDTIDLSKQTIEDIIRHWVILPICRVEYVEANKPQATTLRPRFYKTN